MKRLFAILLGTILIVSCKKYPDADDLSREYLVQTNYDVNVNFKTRYAKPNNNYYMPDTISLISDTSKDTIWYDKDAKVLLNEIAGKMAEYGYNRITDPNLKNTANLWLLVTYIKDLQYIRYQDPNWWWYYPSYWSSGYWGWLPWYYPYHFTYVYAMGSVVIETIDPIYDPQNKSKASVVWSMYGKGILSRIKSHNIEYCLTAIDQAYTQSAYLKLN